MAGDCVRAESVEPAASRRKAIMKNSIHDVWSFVSMQGPDDCWPFTGYCDNSRRGQFSVDGVTKRPYKLIYELVKGKCPAGQVVRHTCSNANCCNPKHLEAG